MKILISLILLLISAPATALDFHPTIAIYSFYNRINDPNIDYYDDWKPIDNISSINLGLTLSHNNFTIGTTTNRLFNRTVDRRVKMRQSGKIYDSSMHIITDSVYLSYNVKRWQPSLFLTNARVKRGLYQNDTVIKETKKTAILYGVSLGYFFTKNIQGSLVFVAPNKELFIEGGFGLGVNLFF